MTSIPGSVRVAGFIAPFDSTDTYAVTDEVYGKGGWRTVADLAARNAITSSRRSLGMIVRVLDTGSGDEGFYTLRGGLTDAYWVVENFGGSSSEWDLISVSTSTYTVADDCSYKLYNLTYVAGIQVVTLPLAANTLEGSALEFYLSVTRGGNLAIITASGSDTISSQITNSSSIGSSEFHARVRLISDGVSSWNVSDADGMWGGYTFNDPTWDLDTSYRFNGNVPGSTEDNITTFDADGNIKDSGIGIADVQAGNFDVEVITAATYDMDPSEINTSFVFINPTPGEHVAVTLPPAVSVGEGAVIDVLDAGVHQGESSLGVFSLAAYSGDTILWPGGDTVADRLATTKDHSKLKLISDGTSVWGILDAYGWWGEVTFGEGGATFDSKFTFSGNIEGSTENNIVIVDEFGNIKDSGVQVGTTSLNVEVITEASYEILYSQVGTAFSFINPSPGDHVQITLPLAADAGEGSTLDILVVGPMVGESTTGTFALNPAGADTFVWTNGDHSASTLGTSQDYSKIRLISDGVNLWGILDAYGLWGEVVFGEGGVTYDSKHTFSANLYNSTEDNVVTFDADGNIKDSGIAIDGLGGEFSGAYDTLFESTTIDLLDEEEFTLEEDTPYTDSGVGYLLEVTPTTGTGQISVEVYDDVAKTRLVCTHVIDLEAPTLRSSTTFGFNAETTGVLYCTLYCSGVPDSQTATFTLHSVITSPQGAPTPMAGPYGDGIEDNGFGLPQIALSSTGGLKFDTGKLVVKTDVAADVQVVGGVDGLSVTGAVTTTTNEIISAQKVFNSVGCLPMESSGVPLEGTYDLGSEIVDDRNIKYRCLVGGTPGTWDLVDTVSNQPLVLASTSIAVGGTYLFSVPSIGDSGYLLYLRVWAHTATGTADSEIPFRVRIYETTSELGREVVWQGMGIARQTALTVELPASQTYLEVASNDVIEVDEGLFVFEDSDRYEFARCSARATGYINISEALVDSSSWAVGTLVLPVSEWHMVPWINLDGNPVNKQHIFVQVRHDGLVADPNLVFYVQLKAVNFSSIIVVEEGGMS